MSDTVILDGDLALFLPVFGAATVVALPGRITGSGPPTLGGRAICIQGDESSVEVPGCMYMTPQYSIPGTGTLRIAALAGDQSAQKSRIGGQPMLLRGGRFTAKFQVQAPAQQPPPGTAPPIPDSTPEYSGSGSFIATNLKLTAT